MSGWLGSSAAVFPDDTAWITIYAHDTMNGGIHLVDQHLSDDGFYSFDGLSSGTYLIRAGILDDENGQNQFVPTYLGRKVFWQEGISSVITHSNIENPVLELISITPQMGSGKISGIVSSASGDGLMEISLILLDSAENIIAHTTSRPNGSYEFENVEWGNYVVYAEIPGKLTYPQWVDLGAASPNAEWINFIVKGDEIHGTTDVESLNLSLSMSLFPNPVSQTLQLVSNQNYPEGLSWRILNYNGQTCMRGNWDYMIPSELKKLDVSLLSSGFYILNVYNQTDQIYLKFMKA